ncbi:MAG TPA: zf-HC2 domain-containing protein, partial [Candidatus Polarisedimenticolia bacterium]|nr:zf-HC2 domain-containing protein [Candidatus Polarisedimenticolia bacterium]
MERLSEYLDGGMERPEREALEAHLRDCSECAGVLEDLERVRARARELNEAPVPKELWSRIERAIAPGAVTHESAAPRVTRLTLPGRGRFAFSLPELAAACLAVAVLSGGAVFAVLRHAPAPVVSRPVETARAPETPSSHQAPATTQTASNPASEEFSSQPRTIDAVPASRGPENAEARGTMTETPNEEAISELRKALASKRDKLDPATIRTLETNLAIIDLAIDQAKRALVADSENTYVKEHLAETMRRKVELLQR